MNYLKNLALAFDQLANALLAGSADESLSSRAHRQREKGNRYWGWTANAIDAMFFWQPGHCQTAWRQEVERKQMHPSFRPPGEAGKTGY